MIVRLVVTVAILAYLATRIDMGEAAAATKINQQASVTSARVSMFDLLFLCDTSSRERASSDQSSRPDLFVSTARM